MADLVAFAIGEQARLGRASLATAQTNYIMITLYVIQNINNNFRYVGITNDLKRRLIQHNSGKNKSTYTYKPFHLVYTEQSPNYKEARLREVYLKSGSGKNFLNTLK